jgi:hypothetical protein
MRPKPDPDAVETQVAESIMTYLRDNPHAMDTADGIAVWWIRPDSLRANVATVRSVLDRLAQTGELLKVGEGDRAHYGLRRFPQ